MNLTVTTSKTNIYRPIARLVQRGGWCRFKVWHTEDAQQLRNCVKHSFFFFVLIPSFLVISKAQQRHALHCTATLIYAFVHNRRLALLLIPATTQTPTLAARFPFMQCISCTVAWYLWAWFRGSIKPLELPPPPRLWVHLPQAKTRQGLVVSLLLFQCCLIENEHPWSLTLQGMCWKSSTKCPYILEHHA